MGRAGWVGIALGLVVGLACEGSDGDSGSDGGTGASDCNCTLGAYFPACGVDGMTYDATCGLDCVPVEVECMGYECPCPEPSTGGSGDGSAGGTDDGNDATADDGNDATADDGTDATGGGTGIECGELVCPAETPICAEVIAGPAGKRPSYSCEPLPEMCVADPTCACVNASAGCDCTEDPPGFFLITCTAP